MKAFLAIIGILVAIVIIIYFVIPAIITFFLIVVPIYAAKSCSGTTRKDALEFLSKFENMLCDCFVIDSNIWMNQNYDDFFFTLKLACTRKNYRLSLFGPQFDEIANIKKSTNYTSDNNHRARLAINRIESFQKQGLLSIRPVSDDAMPHAYADPLIVRLMIKCAKSGYSCAFMSDDKELRIRVRQNLLDHAKGAWEIVEMDSLLHGCFLVVRSFKHLIIPDFIKRIFSSSNHNWEKNTA